MQLKQQIITAAVLTLSLAGSLPPVLAADQPAADQSGAASSANAATPLLISATLESSKVQTVLSPLTDSWQVQVQWLAPEQTYVKAGEPVAVFDAGSLQSTIAGFDNDLLRLKDELAALSQEQQLKVLEAEYELKRQQLLLQKAQLEAAVPLAQRSKYDYDLFQLQLQRQQTESRRAEQNLLLVRQTADSMQQKKQLELTEKTENRAKAVQQLDRMKVLAQYDGLVSYGLHAWYGTKLSAGATVQPGWDIVRVASAEQLHIQAWVHEADVAALHKARRFTGRLDAYPSQPVSLQLATVASQGEVFAQWGKAAYYKATFTASQLPDQPLMLGMGMLVEALP